MLHRTKLRLSTVVLLLICALPTLSRPAAGQALADPASNVQSNALPKGGTLFVPSASGEVVEAPLRDTRVSLRVTGPIARATVHQRFHNPSDVWIEGLYVYPLPESSAVDVLEMRIGERVVKGEIQKREEARKTYERARSEGRKASLVEQERPNLFTTAVANIGPGEEIEITIEYQEVLRYEDGGFALRLPLVVAPRYTPAGAGTSTDSSHTAAPPEWLAGLSALGPPFDEVPVWTRPEAGPLHRVHVEVALDAGFPIERLWSPSHALRVSKTDATRRTIAVTARADRDLVLRWRLARGAAPRAAIFSEPDARGSGASVMAMVLPPNEAFTAQTVSREVVIVIDTSGSMGGASIRQAREALLLALDRLHPDDRFNVIAFDSETRRLFPRSAYADPVSLERAREFVRSLEADGGTEMLPALRAALGPGAASAEVRQVIFITDGSISNETELFSLVHERLGRSRLFAVGIGSAPNGYFLKRVARFGRGTFTFIATPAEVAERMQSLFEKLERPALCDLEIHWNDPVEMWPERIPDLYVGEPLVVTARVPRFVGDVLVTGTLGDRPWEARLPLEPGELASGIGKLWARAKIASLMDGMSAGADPAAVKRDVTSVALEHHLVSRFTSLVAVDVTPTRPVDAESHMAPVALNLPHGWKPGLAGGVLPRAATPGPLLVWLGSVSLALAWALRRRGGTTR